MKKRFLAILATGLFLIGMTGVAQAYTITTSSGSQDVGSHDLLIDYTAKEFLPGPGTSQDAELEWVRDVLDSDDWYFIVKDEDGDEGWFDVIDEELGIDPYIAHALQYEPAYFIIKTGEGGGMASDFEVTGVIDNVTVTKSATHFLFQNVDDFKYAVISLAEMGFTSENLDYTVVSHISEFNGAPVPEPATMLLFGTGLAGLAAVGRRRKN